jgi:hypothetical protein
MAETKPLDGRTVFRGHGIYGWNAQQQTYTWYWCDSMGQVPSQPSRGRWRGDTLVFESSSPQARVATVPLRAVTPPTTSSWKTPSTAARPG